MQQIFAPHAVHYAALITPYCMYLTAFSDDESLWKEFVVNARVGLINWNRPTTGAASTATCGGLGKSGNHRPIAYYAADYCKYPVASIENSALEMHVQLSSEFWF